MEFVGCRQGEVDGLLIDQASPAGHVELTQPAPNGQIVDITGRGGGLLIGGLTASDGSDTMATIVRWLR